MAQTHIIGRYAPSPTGDLHLGNLRTALLAWLQARLAGGEFLVRMEDLDAPRNIVGSADQILRDLEWLGLDWDGDVVYQSQRQALYQAALEELQQQDLVYACFCSRKDIQHAVSAPHSSTSVYPGTCSQLSRRANQINPKNKSPALRIRVGNTKVEFDDACLGAQCQNLETEVGDFVIRRADGLFAYQLAVVVDDIDQRISDVVRGADLIDSTARQIYLAQLLPHHSIDSQRSDIRYWHVPLLLDKNGQRMAKRDGSQSVQSWRSQGKSAEALIAELASSLGLCENDDALTANELLLSLDSATLMRQLDHA